MLIDGFDEAETEADRAVLEQFRAYIVMMRARALASQALKDEEPKAAIHAIDVISGKFDEKKKTEKNKGKGKVIAD